ncbi:hypothetical protein C4K15_4049 [Pseudomonas chlororaphis subsp. aurantiaca]|nr:hypothetical protein C4K15_4049 [Pseudomonas chlororaphis subsp. aurantiaca]
MGVQSWLDGRIAGNRASTGRSYRSELARDFFARRKSL